MNPRRPTPSGPEPTQPLPVSIPSILGEGNGCHNNNGCDVVFKGGTLIITRSLIAEFKVWLLQVNPDITEKTLATYIARLSELLGKELTGDVLREFAAKTKWHYMTATRLLTFLRKKYRLRELVEELREALGKRPRSRADTWIPPDNMVLEAGRKLESQGPVYYAAWQLLVSSGARLREVHYALSEADWSRLNCNKVFCRLHIDYERGPKRAWIIYMPRNVSEYITSNILYKEYVPGYDKLEREILGAGVAAKYYRNWVSNKMLVLGIPEAVIEFITGKTPSSILRKHYLQLQYQADTFYPKYSQWLQANILGL